MLSSSSCLSASLGDKELFSTANSKYSPNSRCRPSSYLLAVLAVFLFLPRETSEMFRHFVLTTKTI